jgi:hypothetical protein
MVKQRPIAALPGGNTEPDPNVRVLKTMKSNYASVGGEIRLRWHAGIFFLEEDDVAAVAAADARQLQDEALFCELLDEFTAVGRNVGEKPGTSFAPALFAESPRGKAVGKARFKEAMSRLFAKGAIRVAEYGRPSRLSRRLETIRC